MSRCKSYDKAEYVRYRKSIETTRRRLAERGMSPYDEMTLVVEKETGTKSETWNMIDERWERVVFLARESIGIPQDVRPRWESSERTHRCKHGHNMDDPQNVYEWTTKDGYIARKCRACQRASMRAFTARKQAKRNRQSTGKRGRGFMPQTFGVVKAA